MLAPNYWWEASIDLSTSGTGHCAGAILQQCMYMSWWQRSAEDWAVKVSLPHHYSYQNLPWASPLSDIRLSIINPQFNAIVNATKSLSVENNAYL